MLLSGALDIDGAFSLRKALFAAVDAGAARVVVDFEGVDLLDSTGLGVLVAAVKRGSRHPMPTTIELVCSTPKTLWALRLTRLDRVLLVHRSLDDALIGTSAAVRTECDPDLDSTPVTPSRTQSSSADTAESKGRPPEPAKSS